MVFERFQRCPQASTQSYDCEILLGRFTYDDEFACNDLGNKYLDEDTIDRVISESGGDLDREDPGSDNNQYNSFARVRRRRKKMSTYFKTHPNPKW